MKNDKETFKILENFWKKIPSNMKISVMGSLIIGLIGHMYCYTNLMFLHDTAALYWDSQSFAEAAAGTRWLYPIYNWILGGVQLPWMDGILTLLLYGIAAWLVCEVLEIKGRIAVFLTAGLMALSPTAIASNAYLSSAPIYASALLLAALSIYAFYHWKHGFLWFVAIAVLCEGTYAAYIGFSLCLFFLRNFVVLLETPKEQGKKIFLKHIQFLLGLILSLLFTYLLIKLLTHGRDVTLQARVTDVENFGISNYLQNIYFTFRKVMSHFLPGGSASYMQEQTAFYVIFILGMCVNVILYVYCVYRKKLICKKLCLLLLFADVIFLPFAMNLFRLITDAHLLMQFGYISPWLFCIELHEYTMQRGKLFSQEKEWMPKMYTALTLLLVFATLGNWCVLANTSYTKAAAVYQANVSLLNRVVDRIERADNYEIGETPVAFVGSTRQHYAPYREGFAITDSVTGIGSDWWDTGLTYSFPMMKVITQHLGIDMNIINDPGGDRLGKSQALRYAEEVGMELDLEQFWAEVDEMSCFPSENCMRYIQGILVFKFNEE